MNTKQDTHEALSLNQALLAQANKVAFPDPTVTDFAPFNNQGLSRRPCHRRQETSRDLRKLLVETIDKALAMTADNDLDE
jgi:hypothetical protein